MKRVQDEARFNLWS